MKKERLYLLLLLALLLSALLAMGLFNAIIDPHRFFNLVSMKGINEYKTYVTKMRLRKPVHIYQRKPTILIMGSSRAGGGLHCQDLTEDVDQCYNSALRGITTYEQYRLLEHSITVAADADKKIQQVVLKLSYATFTETELIKEGFEEELSTHENEGVGFVFRKAVFEKYLYALFAWETLTDSRMTIEYQDKPYAWRATSVWNFEPDGSWNTYVLSEYKNKTELVHSNRRKQWESSVKAMTSQFSFLKNQLNQQTDFERNYDNFEKLLELAYRHQIPLAMMFSAEHADYLMLMDKAGIWNDMETWKRRVISMNEEIAARHHAQPYQIWDFGGFNKYSTETSWNRLKPGESMQWYEDIVHFQGNLGAIMLGVLRDKQIQGDWFEVVDSRNIDRYLEKIRHDRDEYRKIHGDDVLYPASGENQ